MIENKQIERKNNKKIHHNINLIQELFKHNLISS